MDKLSGNQNNDDMDNNLPTIECYNMQGRENINKTIGTFIMRHNITEESEKRGRKTQEQKLKHNDFKLKLTSTIYNYENQLIIDLRNKTLAHLQSLVPGAHLGNIKTINEMTQKVKELLIQQKKKEERQKYYEKEDRIPRLKTFLVLAKCYRRLLFRTKIEIKQIDPQQY